jgi:hypothetical protein
MFLDGSRISYNVMTQRLMIILKLGLLDPILQKRRHQDMNWRQIYRTFLRTTFTENNFLVGLHLAYISTRQKLMLLN